MGFFLLDIKEQRVFEAPGGTPPTELPLLSYQQWSSLNDVLSSRPGGGGAGSVTHLVVCSEVPFVDDGLEEANYKAGIPSHQHVSATKEAFGSYSSVCPFFFLSFYQSWPFLRCLLFGQCDCLNDAH